MAMRSARRRLILSLACAGVALGQAGCGGSTSAKSAATAGASADWGSRTEQLCREKRAAIAGLGYVHITYAGIARVGLPAVKRELELYLGRLLGVLQDFAARQRQLVPPSSLRQTMALAAAVNGQSYAVTSRLRRDVASVRSATELSGAFRVWLTSLQGLAARGDQLARQLNLPGCRSGQ